MSNNNTERRPSGRGGRGARSDMGNGPINMIIPGQKPKDFRRAIGRLLLELKPFRIRLFIIILITIASTIIAIATPHILSEAITTMSHEAAARMKGVVLDPDFMVGVSKIFLTCILLYVVSAVLAVISGLIMASVSQRVVYELRRKISEKIPCLPLKYFDGHTHGEILSRITNDIDTVGNALAQSLSQLINAALSIIGALVMMLVYSFWLTLVVFVALPISMALMMFVMKRSQKYFKAQQSTLGTLNGHIEEMFGGHRVVKAFGREPRSVAEFNEQNSELYTQSWKAQFFAGFIFPIMHFIDNLVYVGVSVLGMIFVVRGTIETGKVVSFIRYASMFTDPISQFSQIISQLQSTIAGAERVFEVLDEDEQDAESPNPVELDNIRGGVSFQNVAFGYTDGEPLIKNMNIDAHPGQVVAIVGPTGAGKTTIVNLLMRFYEIRSGSIKIDGVDIRDMTRAGLRKHIGMVLQDTWLYNDTIAHNIAYSKENATEDEIKAAAWNAQAHRFIKRLPHGYNTVINEESTNISQGQKQLLTIARALLADPSILILDEATSSVDTITEIHIREAMNELMKGRTCFVIAHRLSTIKNADTILVMNNGDIIEQGNHTELLAANGFYHDLYHSQFDKVS